MHIVLAGMAISFIYLYSCIVLLCLCQFVLVVQGDEYTVAPHCASRGTNEILLFSGGGEIYPECVRIDEALDALTSDSVIILEQGMHLVTQPHIINGLRNVSLIGASRSGVYITCVDSAGLGFLNIVGLSLVNLTVHDCGMQGEQLQNATDILHELVDSWFIIPTNVRIALFFGHCTDLTMTHVSVNGTRGLGMLAVNIVGDSILSHVNFTHNTRLSCIPDVPVYPFTGSFEQIGGGAYFLYHDYFSNTEELLISENNSLQISDSYFSYNADCSYSTLSHINYKYFIGNHTIGAGGGLSVFYAHSNYSLSVRVESTTFYRNDARYGAGAYVASFADFSYPNHMIFDNCIFRENGKSSVTSNGVFAKSYCRGGAGLAIFTDFFKPGRAINNVQNISIAARRTEFIKNAAEIEGGGVFAYSFVNSPHRDNFLGHEDYFSVEWELRECVFRLNRALLNSAASFVQRIFHSADGIVVLYLDSITVSNNGAEIGTDYTNNEVSSAISLKNVFVLFEGTSVFVENPVAALHIMSAICLLSDNAKLEFLRNTGQRGAGIYFEGNSPGLFVSRNSTIIFRENTALVEGGAIFYGNPLYAGGSLQPLDYFGCLLDIFPVSDLNLFTSGSRLEFYGNSAPVGGVIYGTTLETCPWTAEVNAENGNLLFELYKNYNSTFVFDQKPVGRNQTSTPSSIVNVNVTDKVIPGEVVDINIDVFDQFGNKIFDVVTSNIYDEYANSMLGDSGFWYTSEENATVRILGAENQTYDVIYFTYTNVVNRVVRTELSFCPAGFRFDGEVGACACDPKVFDHSHSEFVQCDYSSITISTVAGSWIGMELDAVDSMDSGDLIIHKCYSDYCRENTAFRPPDYDAQCGGNHHRTGVLCGACSQNYSAVFGTSECMVCSNFYLLIIPVFLLLGVLVFAVIAFLDVTIDKGWLNAVLFYTNIIVLYAFDVFQKSSILHLLLLPAHFLNLELGFSLCFYDGMSALSRTFTQLLFPIYLYILMGTFWFITRWYSFNSFSPVKSFVTINILSYVSLLNTCIEILAGHSIHTVKGSKSIRWLMDGNQLYFRGWHAFLGICALIIMIGYLFLFTISILFPSLIYRYIRKGKPFFDALYAPFKEKYRFWIGFRLLIRALMIIFVRFMDAPMGLVLNLIILLTLLHVQTNIQPFRSKWLNVVDSYLITNLAILYIGALTQITSNSSNLVSELIFAILFLGIAYLIIVFIFGYYIDMRYPIIREKLMKCIHGLMSRQSKKMGMSMENIALDGEGSPPRSATNSVLGLSQPFMQEPGHNNVERNSERHYRDSILDTI